MLDGSTFNIADLRELGPDAVVEYLEALSDAECDALLHDWSFLSRSEQRPPDGDWAYWLYLAGRGAGKTRTGAEWVREQIINGFRRGGLIAPTASDARDVMVEGESGLLAVCWENDVDVRGIKIGIPLYEPSKRRLTWANGAMCTLYSADEPERLRGPQHEFIWADELCAWRRPETWDLAMFGLRLGMNPRAFISTTPKPNKLILELVKDPATAVTRGTTFSNSANLAPKFLSTVVKKYEGTRLGQQELEGLLLEEAEGALWSRAVLDGSRRPTIPRDPDFYFKRIVVAVDPAVTSNAESNLTGIVVAGLGSDDHGYVLADATVGASPAEWAKAVARAYNTWRADIVVAEGNQGGELVSLTLATADKRMNVRTVHASRGKRARAEPVAALFEKGEAHIVGTLNALEDQLCTWEPLGDQESPDRLDAMVWALTELMLGSHDITTSRLKGAH